MYTNPLPVVCRPRAILFGAAGYWAKAATADKTNIESNNIFFIAQKT